MDNNIQPASSHKGNILIIYDTARIAAHLKKIFAQNGYNTMVIAEGLSALKIVQSNKIDFIITRMRLPAMDGFKLARKIIELDMEMPIIMIEERCDKEASALIDICACYSVPTAKEQRMEEIVSIIGELH